MVAVIMLLARAALADLAALRLSDGPAVALAGAPVLSVAAPLTEDWSVAASYRWRSSVDVSAGRRWVHPSERGDRGWTLGASGGTVLPLWDPGLALSASVHAHRWRVLGESTLRCGLASPAAVRLTGGVGVRLPVQAEVVLTRRVGRVRVGVYGGGGLAVTPGAGWALGGQAGAVVSGG